MTAFKLIKELLSLSEEQLKLPVKVLTYRDGQPVWRDPEVCIATDDNNQEIVEMY